MEYRQGRDSSVPRSRSEREAGAQRRAIERSASRGRVVEYGHHSQGHHEEAPPQRVERISVLVVMLGQTEVHIPGPPCERTARTLAKALALMRDRMIDEDSARQALDVFESALTGPLQYKGAHLCLAEIYIAGSAPQIGKDYRRAVTELVTFLEVSDSADYREVLGQEQLFNIARETARVAQYLDSSGLGPLSNQLTRLACEIPMLQGSALRACLLRLERIDGAPCMALAVKGSAPPPPSPVDFLNNLLKDMNVVEAENAMLKIKLEEERAQLSLFANTLEREKDKRLEAEELVCRFSASAQQIHKANERLAERIEGEVLRADKAEANCVTAEVDSDELRREIVRLRRELEAERRKGLSNERDSGDGSTTARVSPDPRKTSKEAISGSMSSRQSPAPDSARDSRSTPNVLQGYMSARRPSSNFGNGNQDYMQVSHNQEQELKQWLNAQSRQTASPAPREVMHMRQSSASPAPQTREVVQPPMLRERNLPNGRAGSATGKRDSIDADRKHLRSSLANGVLNAASAARGNQENIALF